MTDSTTPPPADGSTPPAQPAYTPASAEGPKQSLSLASFIVGLASFVLSWIFGLGLIPGIVAVVLGFKAKKQETGAPQWMWLVGIISGFVGIGLSVIIGLVTIVSVVLPLIIFGSAVSTYGY